MGGYVNMYVQLDTEGRITGTAEYNCFPENTTVIESNFPEEFDFNNQSEYLIIDGKLISCESNASKLYNNENRLSVPQTIAEQDDAICALYEENLALKAVSAEQDDAICYLYESIMEGQENG